MNSVFKVFVPCSLALYLASACAPDLDSLSAEYSATVASSGSGNSVAGMGASSSGSGNTSSSGSGNGGAGRAGAGPVDVCQNEAKDANESDADCGGSSECDRCISGASCTVDGDCKSDFCKAKRCADPTCFDKVINQNETAIDCGGVCVACDLGVTCSINSDCTDQYCKDGVCSDHCASGAKELDETAVDCGGSCKPCGANMGCTEASDCESKVCLNKKCLAATCSDQTINQDESDLDCGGVCSATKPCQVGAHCKSAADCGSWICSAAGKCLADIVVDPLAIIDDFEDGDTSLPKIDGREGPWYHYGDSSTGALGSIAPVVISRGASTRGMRTTGMGYSVWGSGAGTNLKQPPAGQTWYDASAYDSVTFWARAQAPITFLVVLPDIDTDPVGKTCVPANNGCDHHYFKSVSVGTTWQRVTVAFADLSLEPGTMPVPTRFAPEAIVAVQFRFAPGLDYDLYLDDVAFLKAN